MGLILITPPASEPVTLAEAKSHLRVDDSTDDTLITALITAARQKAEDFTRRAFFTQTWDLSLDTSPQRGWLDLPRPLLQSVTSITYYQDDGVQQTFSSSNYLADTTATPGRIALKTGQVWPTSLRPLNALVVRFLAGWSSLGNIPDAVKLAIKITLSQFYENREGLLNFSFPSELAASVELPPLARTLLNPYRVLLL